MKNNDWGRGGGGLNREGGGLIERGGGLINFPPLKRGGSLLERGGLIEDLRYAFSSFDVLAGINIPVSCDSW